MTANWPAERALSRSADELSSALDALQFEPGHNVVEVALAEAVDIERDAALLGATDLEMRARLVQADMLDRKGETTSGVRLAWEVNRWALQHDHRPLLAKSHVLLSTGYHNLGDPAACLEHAGSSVEMLDDTTEPRARAHHLTKLGDALGWTGSFDAARERYRNAESIVLAIGDSYRHLVVLNNMAYTEYEAGELDRAWEVVGRLQAAAAAYEMPLEAMFLDTVGRVQVAVGRFEEAEQTMQLALEDYAARGYEEADGLAEYLLTLATSQRCLGRTEDAQASLRRCYEICDERRLAEIRVRAQEEQAELYAADGRFEEAFALHKVFHAEAEALRSLQREARATTRQAMLEVTEARRDAHRFRELALRDPLTGLHNRRFVDEQLPAMIDRSRSTGSPLSLAVVDIDRFKRINDTLSHDVGDQVLITMAGLLTATLGAPGRSNDDTGLSGLVARIGGEEFLIALPDTASGDAARRFEELRLAVSCHPWYFLTGDLPVTVSIGATTTHGTTKQAALIAEADRNLYLAKRGGRDRVVAGAPQPIVERRRYRSRI